MIRLRSTFLLLLVAMFSAAPAFAKPYKGAEIYSQEDCLYGKIEMRMRMARGSGILSTFFLYKDGSEQTGAFWEEVDIEVFGKNNATTWQSNIITGYAPRQYSEGVHNFGSSLADAYHTYTIEWRPGSVRWLLDGVEVRNTVGGQANALTSAESLRFNIWAAFAEGWVGPFDDSVLPQYQYVNWVKFYSYQGGNFVLAWTDEFDTFNTSRWGKANWTFAENRVDFAPENAVVQNGILVLAITHEGQTGYTGTPPADDDEPAGSGGASSGGAGSGGDQGAGGDVGSGGNLGSGGDGGLVPTGGAFGAGGSMVGIGGGAIDPAGTGGAYVDPGVDSGDGDNDDEVTDPGEGAGCSCRAAPTASRMSPPWALSVLLGALLLGRGRRRSLRLTARK